MDTHDRDRHLHQVQLHTTQPQRFDRPIDNKSLGPSKTKVLAIIALLPVAGALLGLASITLAGIVIGLLATVPIFVILISPILVPAVLTIGLALAGFLTAGTFGLRQVMGMGTVDLVKRRFQNVVEFMGQKTKDAGRIVEDKGYETGPEGPVHGGRV